MRWLRPRKLLLEVAVELGLDRLRCRQHAGAREHVGEIGRAEGRPWESQFGGFNPFLAGRV